MTYASPFLDPNLDAPASRTATHTHQPSGPSHERAGATPLNTSNQHQEPFSRSRAEAGCSQKFDLRPDAECGFSPFKVEAPHINSSRDLLEGFASIIRLQAEEHRQSVIFALIAMLGPTVIAVTAGVIALHWSQPIY